MVEEESYRVEIGKLRQQIRDLEFENSLQVDTDRGEKSKLAQENEALKDQIRQMRRDADKQQRSRSDERLIKGLKREIGECRDDLKKSKDTIAQLQEQGAKRT